ncbi:MAG TPA: hypothetical protein VMM81_07095 [Acidimicrobiia bacterium]|nr:hypothetical protein [Acidimicrobiia bacterium]
MKTRKLRSNTDVAKSALGGLATFGAEMGRLVGRGAKSLWEGARKMTSKAASKAKDKAADAAEAVADKLD